MPIYEVYVGYTVMFNNNEMLGSGKHANNFVISKLLYIYFQTLNKGYGRKLYLFCIKQPFLLQYRYNIRGHFVRIPYVYRGYF